MAYIDGKLTTVGHIDLQNLGNKKVKTEESSVIEVINSKNTEGKSDADIEAEAQRAKELQSQFVEQYLNLQENPESEMPRFSQTVSDLSNTTANKSEEVYVKVAGQDVLLSAITSKDEERMTSEEYEEYYRLMQEETF